MSNNNKSDCLYSQIFSEYVDVYEWSEKLQDVVKLPQKKNQQAYIQSYADCALDKVLERYIDNMPDTDPYELLAGALGANINELSDDNVNDCTRHESLLTLGDYNASAVELQSKFLPNATEWLDTDKVYQEALKRVEQEILKRREIENEKKTITQSE